MNDYGSCGRQLIFNEFELHLNYFAFIIWIANYLLLLPVNDEYNIHAYIQMNSMFASFRVAFCAIILTRLYIAVDSPVLFSRLYMTFYVFLITYGFPIYESIESSSPLIESFNFCLIHITCIHRFYLHKMSLGIVLAV